MTESLVSSKKTNQVTHCHLDGAYVGSAARGGLWAVGVNMALF